jgi:putative ABC transport system permease protein
MVSLLSSWQSRLFLLGLRVAPQRFRERWADEMLATFEQRLVSLQARKRSERATFVLREAAAAARAGMAARRAEQRAYGGELGFERSGGGRFDRLLQDLRVAVRGIRRNPGFAAIVVLVLGLGIGASVAIFSAVDAVLLRPLPFAQPNRLMTIWESRPGFGAEQGLVSGRNWGAWQDEVREFTGVAAWRDEMMGIEFAGEGPPHRFMASMVSGNFFDVLGRPTLLGRGFHETDKFFEADAPIVVVSWHFWQDALGADSTIIGKTINLQRRRATVIGVMPRGFQFPREQTDLWLPIGWEHAELGNIPFRVLRVVARLAPGATLEDARARVVQVAAVMEKTEAGKGRKRPDDDARNNLPTTVGLAPLHHFLARDARPPLFALLAAVGLLLLTASANVGNLILLRGVTRARELAVRSALGAGRKRIIAQLITEGFLLVVLAGAAGHAGWCLGHPSSGGLSTSPDRDSPADRSRCACPVLCVRDYDAHGAAV